MTKYRFSHGRVNSLEVDSPNHGALSIEAVKIIDRESANVKDRYTLLKGGLKYVKNGNMLFVYMQVGNSMASNSYVDCYVTE